MKFVFSFIMMVTLMAPSYSQTLQEGQQFYYYERFESAGHLFHEVIQKDPNNAEAWCWLIRSCFAQGKWKNAADTLLKAPTQISEDPFYQAALAGVLLNTDQVDKANSLFQNAIEKTKSKNVPLLAAIADILIMSEKGDMTYTLNLLQAAIKREKKNADLYVSRGKVYRKLHDGTAAYRAFSEAIDRNKHAAAAYYEMGKIFVTQKNTAMHNEYFKKAIEADNRYSPAYYALYTYNLYTDPAKAFEYFRQYAANADPSLQQQYDMADLLYLNKKYDSAISLANKLMASEGDSMQTRLFKLISYSYMEKKDSASAMGYMQAYLANETDSNFIAKDFETTSLLYNRIPGKQDSAMYYLEKAAGLSTDEKTILNYYRQLAAYAKASGNNAAEAKWIGKIYEKDSNANNVTLFNWGLAAYKAEDFVQADSIFEIYTTKYPEQGFGYYWRARSNAAIDTTMEQGLAIPHYQKLLEVIDIDSASATDKKWMKEAYGYLASFEANTEKDYDDAVTYFEKLLVVDPTNEQAKQNIEILVKFIEKKKEVETESADQAQ